MSGILQPDGLDQPTFEHVADGNSWFPTINDGSTSFVQETYTLKVNPALVKRRIYGCIQRHYGLDITITFKLLERVIMTIPFFQTYVGGSVTTASKFRNLLPFNFRQPNGATVTKNFSSYAINYGYYLNGTPPGSRTTFMMGNSSISVVNSPMVDLELVSECDTIQIDTNMGVFNQNNFPYDTVFGCISRHPLDSEPGYVGGQV